MRDHGPKSRMRTGLFALALAIFILAVDGGVARTEALDRWVGTLTGSAEGITVPFDFTVLVNPGVGASFEWRFRSVQIFSGSLAASVSGSRVNGTMFFTGGLAVQSDSLCCRPCNFSGTITGNRVDGTLDSVSCGGAGIFFLIKQ